MERSGIREGSGLGLDSHIVIDECRRSAWGQWSQVLTRNAAAVQIGLTATPRQLPVDAQPSPEVEHDAQITADNLRYFGEPVYEYTMAQAMAGQFGASGIEGLENRRLFETPAVESAGGVQALQMAGKPAEVMQETRRRLFAV
jgi:hypothetical protein